MHLASIFINQSINHFLIMKFDFLEKGTARLICLPLADTNYLTARTVYGRVIQAVT